MWKGLVNHTFYIRTVFICGVYGFKSLYRKCLRGHQNTNVLLTEFNQKGKNLSWGRLFCCGSNGRQSMGTSETQVAAIAHLARDRNMEQNRCLMNAQLQIIVTYRYKDTAINTVSSVYFPYITNRLTPWSRVLLENLIVGQFVKKFPAFY